MSYSAIITTLTDVRKHPNADKIQLATCQGYQVVVGLDAQEGDEVILFPDDGQLSAEYAAFNNLIGYTDAAGVRQGGYFDKHRRVRAQTFRGEKSEAYVAPLSSLGFTGFPEEMLVSGLLVNELAGIPICAKYVNPHTKQAQRPLTGVHKVRQDLKKLFPEHTDTEQLRFARPGSLIGLVTLTAKCHGTSARSGLVKIPVEQPQTWWQKLLRRKPQMLAQWQSVYGTRRVIKGEAEAGSSDYRQVCHNTLAPHILKGEIWYYEIVGFEDSGASIMPSAGTDKMPKDFQKRFGKTMTYTYGCLPGQCAIYVYRIAVMGEDGARYELPWALVKERCRTAGIEHVPEIGSVLVKGEEHERTVYDAVEHFTEEVDLADPIDARHIREGVCVRIDCTDTGKMKTYKNKTFAFKVLEGIVKDSGVVDTEEAEDVEEELGAA